MVADIFDLTGRQLPGQHGPAQAQIGAGLDAVQIVDGHLGGGVEGEIGGVLRAARQAA